MPADSTSAEPSVLSRLGPAGPLAIAALTLPIAGGFVLLYYMATVSEWLRSHGTSGLILYSVAFAVLAGLSFLPTYAQAVLGGFAFGMVWGLPAALIGFVGGAVIGYEIARRAAAERVMEVVQEKPKWRAVRDALVSDRNRGAGFWRTLGMVALIRLPLNSPFAFTNLLLASVKTPRLPMILGTLVGMTPRTAAAIWIGTQMQQFTGKDDLKKAMPWWWLPASIGGGLVVIVVIGWIARRAIDRVVGKAEPSLPS